MKLKQKVSSLLAMLMLLAPMAHAAKLKPQNLTELITHSESIISGQVISVSDGISDNGIPFTEVAIKVNTAAKGKHATGSTYTFRQFGLLKPRKGENGHVMLSVTPEGFPTWNANESVIVFMHKAAKLTGLRTTAGMAHGKFNVTSGKVVNEFNNFGLFNNVTFADGLLSESETQMLSSSGALDAADFMSVVGKAVSQQWISSGRMQ